MIFKSDVSYRDAPLLSFGLNVDCNYNQPELPVATNTIFQLLATINTECSMSNLYIDGKLCAYYEYRLQRQPIGVSCQSSAKPTKSRGRNGYA